MKVIVVGAGSFGSWCAYELQKSGADVTLIDRWGPGNSRSSSGGETRVIRTVYGDDEIYTAMAKKSIELWDQFQAETGSDLMQLTGSLWLCGDDDSYLVSSSRHLKQHGLRLEKMAVSAAIKRWPSIKFHGIQSVYFEPQAGFLRARQACQKVKDQFESLGGDYLQSNILPFDESKHLTSIELADGTHLSADHFVFACGPWLSNLFPETLSEHLEVSRQEVYYFGAPANPTQSSLPIWLDMNHPICYGIPDVDFRGFKIAIDERGPVIDPEKVDRTPSPDLLETARTYLARRFPEFANAPLIEHRICQYTNSPDGHFILDRHGLTQSWIVGAGSGHGFKMGPCIGQMMADAIHEKAPLESRFSLERLKHISARETQFDHSEASND